MPKLIWSDDQRKFLGARKGFAEDLVDGSNEERRGADLDDGAVTLAGEAKRNDMIIGGLQTCRRFD